MKAFVSYSRHDTQFVHRLSGDLRAKLPRVDLWVDQLNIDSGDRLLPEVQRAIVSCDYFLAILSPASVNSSWATLERETAQIRNLQTDRPVIVPVLLGDCDIPETLKTVAFADFRTDYADGLSALTRSLGSSLTATGASADAMPSNREIDISRLPVTGRFLFGRDRELALLNDALQNHQVRIATLVAFGGSGKTALVNEWLARSVTATSRLPSRIYSWSFYAQGQIPSEAVSSDDFLFHALRWYGDADATRGSAHDRSERLARLVTSTGSLLILDGIEVLQNPPGDRGGRVRDLGLAVLLRALAVSGGGSGLCVLTTRLPVADLGPFIGKSVTEVDLGPLDPDAGAQVLQSHHVVGQVEALRRAATRCQGHPLTLTLLGSYLNEAHAGDIAQADRIGPAPDSREYGAHASRVIESYAAWLGGGPEVELLRTISLFDRAAPVPAIDYLRAQSIDGLTDAMCTLDSRQWTAAIWRLRQTQLVSASDTATLDMHPLVREHFRRELATSAPLAWVQGNHALYEYYRTVACPTDLPDTLEEMAPLYAAIPHGCDGGVATDALRSVFIRRIRRGDQHYSLFRLGAVSSDLAALSHFYQVTYTCLRPDLDEAAGVYVLNETGSALRVLGRLEEAVSLAQQAYDRLVSLSIGGVPRVRAARNISKILMQMGRCAEAVEYAGVACNLTAEGTDAAETYISFSTLGRACHLSGLRDEAQEAFDAAVVARMQMSVRWFGLQEAHRCDFLLDDDQTPQAAAVVFDGSQSTFDRLGALDFGLYCLSVGRLALARRGRPVDLPAINPVAWLSDAVTHLHSVMRQDELGYALVARAEALGREGDLRRAEQDLSRAMDIARDASMRPLAAEVLHGRSVLALRGGSPQTASRLLAEAAAAVRDMGYGRLSSRIDRTSAAVSRVAETMLEGGL